MAQVNIPVEPAPGVKIDQDDGRITITILTTPISNENTVQETSKSLWHAAYASLRREHPEELDAFEKEAQSVFRPPQRSNSSNSNAFGRSTSGWHNMSPKAVLGAVRRWAFDTQEEEPSAEEQDEAERDKAAAFLSTKTSLGRSIQDIPSAHLAWAAASLCIHKLAQEDLRDSAGLSYIVSRIAFYDRLSRLVNMPPEDDDENSETNDQTDDPFHSVLVDLYKAVLRQLILVLVLSHRPPETRAQRQKQNAWDNAGIENKAVNSVIALESSIGQRVYDKALEESIANLIRQSAKQKDLDAIDAPDVEEAADTKPSSEWDSTSDRTDDDDDKSYHDSSEAEKKENDASSVNDTESKPDNTIPEHRKIQRLLCGTPVQPPSLPPRPPQPEAGSPDVLASLHNWAQEQEAYRKWHRARSLAFRDPLPSSSSEDAADPKDRILWVHGHADGSTTLLLRALVEAEEKNEGKGQDGGLPRHAVAHAFWDWSRDVDGTSVVSVVRDIVWNVLTTQPLLQEHLINAVEVIGRSTLLGDGDAETKASYAAQGTSCDFYAMLALLCRVVRDKQFKPTCFVVDYMDALLGDDDDVEDVGTHAAQRRTWTLQDLTALVQTTCRLNPNIAWVVASPSSSPAMEDSLVSGSHLQLQLINPKLDEILSCYAGALLRDQSKLADKPTVQSEMVQELARKAGGNVAWMHLAVDLLGTVRLPWNKQGTLQSLPDSSKGLDEISDWIVQKNVNDGVSDGAGDQAHLDAVLYTAALAFRPLTTAEMGALADLPVTADAGILVDVLGRPLLEGKKVDLGGGEAQTFVYFSSRALLASQRNRLLRNTAAPDLHADMVCRHLRALSNHYARSHRGELSLYIKLAWLRHLDRVDTGHKKGKDDSDSPLVKDLVTFVDKHGILWLHDLESIGMLPVVRRLLQDLIPVAVDKGQLSPIQTALQNMLAFIARLQAMGMSLDDMNRFLRMAGHKTVDIDVHDDLPVFPQSPPIRLPELALDTPKVSKAAAFVGALTGHSDWVRDAVWAYDGRLIVSISDDDTLRCWDRASCRMQHVTEDMLAVYRKWLYASLNPTLVIALTNQKVVLFDLAIGTVPAKSISSSYVMFQKAILDAQKIQRSKELADLVLTVKLLRTAFENQEDDQGVPQQASQEEEGGEDRDAKDVADGKSTNDANGNDVQDPSDVTREEFILFQDAYFATDGSNDLVITCTGDGKEAQEFVFFTPELRLKEVRNVVPAGYKSLPANLADVIPESECISAVLADDVGLAAVVNNEGNVVYYNSKTATQTQTIHWTESKFESVEYNALRRVFGVQDVNGNFTRHLVHTPEDQGDSDVGKSIPPPLIRTYKPPFDSYLTSAISPRMDDVTFTFRSNEPIVIYKVIKEEAVVVNGPTDNKHSGDAPAEEPRPFTSTVLSHNGLLTATADSIGQVKLWNLPSVTAGPHATSAATSDPKLRCTMAENTSEVNWLSFSHDDSMLVVCFDNRQAEVWNTDTGERLAILDGHDRWLHFAAFSPNDALVVTTSVDGEARLWDLKASHERYLEKRANLIKDDNKDKDDKDEDDKDEDDKDEDDKDEDDKDEDDKDKNKESGGDADSIDAPISPRRHEFISLNREGDDYSGTIAFSPDGRFLATSGNLGHIFDISSPSSVQSCLPTARTLEPCVRLVYEDVTKTKKKEAANAGKKKDQENCTEDIIAGNDTDPDNDREAGIGGDGDGNQDDGRTGVVMTDDKDDKDDSGDGNGEDENDDNDDEKKKDEDEDEEEEEDDDDDDGDEDEDNNTYRYGSTFVFSPDSRSLFGFSNDGQLLLWKFTDSSWQPQAVVVAGGFTTPDQRELWRRSPRRLSISGTDGQYLLHTEYGVWNIPPPPTDDDEKKNVEIGLWASARHPCNISHTETHNGIFWQDRLVAKLPEPYAPHKKYSFSSYTCDIRSEEGGTSTLVIGTNTGRLCVFRFRGKTDASEVPNLQLEGISYHAA